MPHAATIPVTQSSMESCAYCSTDAFRCNCLATEDKAPRSSMHNFAGNKGVSVKWVLGCFARASSLLS